MDHLGPNAEPVPKAVHWKRGGSQHVHGEAGLCRSCVDVLPCV